MPKPTCIITASGKKVCGREVPASKASRRASGAAAPSTRAALVRGRLGYYLFVGAPTDVSQYVRERMHVHGIAHDAPTIVANSVDSVLARVPGENVSRWNVEPGGYSARDVGIIRYDPQEQAGPPSPPHVGEYAYMLGFVNATQDRSGNLALVHGPLAAIRRAQREPGGLLEVIEFRPYNTLRTDYRSALAAARAARAHRVGERIEIVVSPTGELHIFPLGAYVR